MPTPEHDQAIGPETSPAISDYHLTVYQDGNGIICARQINNEVGLPQSSISALSEILQQAGIKQINIKPDQLNLPEPTEYVSNPINLVFFSSIGAMYGAEMTAREPSDGMWALAEILARESPGVSCLCIDPNIIDYPDIVTKLKEIGLSGENTIFGISSLVQNLPNEMKLVDKLRTDFPKSTFFFGGIGADALSLLPTTKTTFGIDTLWDDTVVIPGLAILELQSIIKRMIDNPGTTIAEIRNMAQQSADGYTSENWQTILQKLQQARILSRKHFIPLEKGAHKLFFAKSYQEMRTGRQLAMSVTDNTCEYTCWFCSTPKDARFASPEDEFLYIQSVAANQQQFAFNNNDLASNPTRTIWLCQEMSRDPQLQLPKHGKMSAAVYRPELLDALIEAGFVRIAIGVETFDATHRRYLKGGNFDDPEAVNKTLNHLLINGVTPEINLILFHPRETLNSLHITATQTLAFVEKGAIVNATLGVNAIPNSYAVKKRLETLKRSGSDQQEINKRLTHVFQIQEIQGPDGQGILFPIQWLTIDPEIDQFKFEVRAQRLKIIENLPAGLRDIVRHNYVPIESYIALFLIQAMIENQPVDLSVIHNYIRNFANQVYVGI